ncbi:hypothetical protein ACQR06_02750 [Bradyrhizobium sp. HKCCYLRH1065]|uniref:hypothetical protein n=1 Tax=Bradyrhizobium sp. HKCCYLRH1065 TaxID=3420753 RepID=UPI003EC0BDE4
MSMMSIMAAILEDELREHGIRILARLDGETIVHSTIERAAKLDIKINQPHLPPYVGDQDSS